MSSVSGSGTEGAWRRSGTCGRMGWKPIELLAMVLGFATFWPIGLAVIGWKFMQRRQGGGSSGEDWFAAVRDKVRDFAGKDHAGAGRAEWAGFAGRSGNAAFDEWRKQEIERLEAERKKLEAAQREFSAFVAEARRARDKEEFERFMSARPQV